MLNCVCDDNEISTTCRWKRFNQVCAASTHDFSKVEYIKVNAKKQYRVIHILPYSAFRMQSKRTRSFTHQVQAENHFLPEVAIKWNISPSKTYEKICVFQTSSDKQHTSFYSSKNLLVHNYAFNLANSIVSDAVKLACKCLKIRIPCKLEKQVLNSYVKSAKSYCGKRFSLSLKRNNVKDFQSILFARKGSIAYNKPSPLAIYFPGTKSRNSERGTLSKRLNSLIYFIHGLGGSADVWKSQLLFFSERGYEVLAVDLLGHGYSSAPDNGYLYVFKQMLNDLLYIFDRYAKQRNIVIGHSYGSAFAACISHKRTLLVKKLVLISGGGPKAMEPRQGLSALLPVYGLAILKLLLCHSVTSERKKSSHLTELSQMSTLPRYVLKHILQGQDWSQGDRPFYRSLGCITLLVYGMKDRFISLTDEIEMEKTIPTSRLEILPNAGHSVMLDSPQELNDVILNFLST